MSTAGGAVRRTKQSEAIRDALLRVDRFITAQQLHVELVNEGSKIGLATVYRQLNTAVAEGFADSIQLPSGQLYRACKPGSEHHHHLVCENCGASVEFDLSDESWLTGVAKAQGYTVTRHVLEIFGLCAECSRAEAAAPHAADGARAAES